jgi:TolB-like protein
MKLLLPLLLLIFINGCTQTQPKKQNDHEIFSTIYDKKQEHTYKNLNATIIDIADQLFKTNYNKDVKTRIILTSFVDLNNLEKTTTFGRLISESMFNELHIREFKVTDFRGQDAVSVNEDGEFHITRDTEKLKESLEEIEFILVGTYVKFENQSLLINARIMDSISGDVVSSARVVYKPKDCSLFGICQNIKQNDEIDIYNIKNQNKKTSYSKNKDTNTQSSFGIVSDDCRDGKCKK